MVEFHNFEMKNQQLCLNNINRTGVKLQIMHQQTDETQFHSLMFQR